MDLSKQNILMFSRATQHGGTENVILQLCKILKPICNKVVVCTADGFDIEELNTLGIKHYVIPDIQNKSPMIMFRIAKKLKHIVREEQITVIHSHHRMAAFYSEILFGRNIIKIANAHTEFDNKRLLTHYIYHNSYVVAVGKKVKDSLINLDKIKEKQVTVIHNAVEPFEKKIEIKIFEEMRREGYTLVGNVSRLSKEKGVEYFIKTIPEVIKRCPKVRFFIIGDGDERANLEHLVENLFINDVVSFWGNRKDIQNIISQLDFIVLSSVCEGLPLTPIEAFSVGKPVVATAVGGTPEIIEDKRNGLLVKPRDIEGLGSAIIELINNKYQRQIYGDNGYTRYINEFSFDKMAERYIDYYKSL